MENGTVNNQLLRKKNSRRYFVTIIAHCFYLPMVMLWMKEKRKISYNLFYRDVEKRKNLPENLNLRAYLYSSVKHACLRYFKRLQLWDEYKKRQAEALVLSFADDDIEDDRELIALVQKALSQLSGTTA